MDRGWYAGPVGWMDATEDGEFCVALRSALLRDREAHLYAGVGVVAGSDPAAELEETEIKLRRPAAAAAPMTASAVVGEARSLVAGCRVVGGRGGPSRRCWRRAVVAEARRRPKCPPTGVRPLARPARLEQLQRPSTDGRRTGAAVAGGRAGARPLPLRCRRRAGRRTAAGSPSRRSPPQVDREAGAGSTSACGRRQRRCSTVAGTRGAAAGRSSLPTAARSRSRAARPAPDGQIAEQGRPSISERPRSGSADRRRRRPAASDAVAQRAPARSPTSFSPDGSVAGRRSAATAGKPTAATALHAPRRRAASTVLVRRRR